MKKVIWTDKRGYMHVSLMRDSDDETNPSLGVPLDPPPLDDILEEAKRDLHNHLVQAGLFTWADVQKAQSGVTNAILAVLRHKIIEAYKG